MHETDSVRRRTVLKQTGAAVVFGATMGTATASGEAWYIAVTDGDAADRLSRHGFEVRNQLADGDVLVVTGREGKTDRIASTSGVSAATVDVPLASPAGEGPTATPPDEVAAEGSPSRGELPQPTDRRRLTSLITIASGTSRSSICPRPTNGRQAREPGSPSSIQVSTLTIRIWTSTRISVVSSHGRPSRSALSAI